MIVNILPRNNSEVSTKLPFICGNVVAVVMAVQNTIQYRKFNNFKNIRLCRSQTNCTSTKWRRWDSRRPTVASGMWDQINMGRRQPEKYRSLGIHTIKHKPTGHPTRKGGSHRGHSLGISPSPGLIGRPIFRAADKSRMKTGVYLHKTSSATLRLSGF